MRILVLGGTGFIGPFLLRQLHEAGHSIAIFNRGITQVDLPEGIQRIIGSNKDINEAKTAFAEFDPDVVIYMIPIGEPDAERVMQTLQGITPRVVGLSSIDVYRAYNRLNGSEPGPIDPTPLTEDSPLREKSYPYRFMAQDENHPSYKYLYFYDKILAENLILTTEGIAGTILRLPMIYGPLDKQHRLFDFVKRMDDNRPAIILDEVTAAWQTSRSYVEDVAAAIACAATNEKAAGRIYNVAETAMPTEKEWVRYIAKAVGWQGQILVLPPEKLPDSMQPDGNFKQHLCADSTRIRSEIGFKEIIDPAEALRRTLQWEREYPPQLPAERFDYATEDKLIEKYLT